MSRFARPSHSVLRALRCYFTDSRQKRLDQSIIASGGVIETPSAKPITWNEDYVSRVERNLRQKLRLVDFVIEVRDARIPVSTIHPKLRAWAGKKPRIVVFNKADLISHQDRLAWDKYFAEKDLQIIWTSAIMKNSGVPNLIRSFFDANFEVNRKRRKTNLVLRKNRMVLSCLVGHPNVGKTSLMKHLLGPTPKQAHYRDIPDKGVPGQMDRSLEWYQVEGGVYCLGEVLDVPPVIGNPVACTRLAFCGSYDEASLSATLIAEHFISHLGALRSGSQLMDRICEDVGIHPRSLTPSDFFREVAEIKFDGNLTLAAQHLLESFQRLDYGPAALEMPYMVRPGFALEEPLLYDKEEATGLQSGIFTRF